MTDVQYRWSEQASDRGRSAAVAPRPGAALDLAGRGAGVAGRAGDRGGDRAGPGESGRPRAAGPSRRGVGAGAGPEHGFTRGPGRVAHLGPTLARRIAEARADGPFRSVEDVRARVRGIGPATLAQIAPYLRIDSPPEIRPRFNSEAIAIVDAGAGREAPGRPARKPPRSRARKAKASSVALAAKSGVAATP